MRVLFMSFLLLFVGCDVDSAKDAATNIQEGGPSVDDATGLQFISDNDQLKLLFGKLDQASVPWVWGTILFTSTVGGVENIPVIFDASNPPALKVDVKIEVAGSTQLGGRAPITIYDGKDVSLSLMQLTAFVETNGEGESYDKIPESVPYVGGKTIYPMYFTILMSDFDWSTAGATMKTEFDTALKAGNLSGVVSSVANNIPVPWLDCETVKITVKYKGTATEEGKYQLETVKYLAADPQVVIDLLGTVTSAAGDSLTETLGFNPSLIVDGLKAVIPAQTCEAPDATDQALFDTAS